MVMNDNCEMAGSLGIEEAWCNVQGGVLAFRSIGFKTGLLHVEALCNPHS